MDQVKQIWTNASQQMLVGIFAAALTTYVLVARHDERISNIQAQLHQLVTQNAQEKAEHEVKCREREATIARMLTQIDYLMKQIESHHDRTSR